jgi:acyl dehydratase
MGHIEASRLIKATPAAVFAVLSDTATRPEWSTLHVGWLGDPPEVLTVGSKVVEKILLLDMANPIEWTVDELSSPDTLVTSGTGVSDFRLTVDYRVESDGGHARVRISADFSGQMSVGEFGKALERYVLAKLDASLEKLAGLTETLTFELDENALDAWTEVHRFDVTRERLAAYAEATNDPIPAHRAGDVANPVFGVVAVFEALLDRVLNAVPSEIFFGVALHGQQYFHFHRPIRPGDQLASRSRLLGWEALPNGTRVTIYIECNTADGEPVNEQWATFFCRGASAGVSVGEQSPPHSFPASVAGTEPVGVVVQHIDDDMAARYAPASGDPTPIHLEDEIARHAGLPGRFLQGLCTMAVTSWAVLTAVGDSDVTRLRRLAVRFARPVFPEQDITSSIWHVSSDDGEATYAFQASAGGQIVIKDGLAVLADT